MKKKSNEISADQKTESIRDLMNNIEKGKIVLPEFQRDFVWEIGKSFALFDSLVRNIFIGAIIYGIPTFEITVRSLDVRPRKGKGSRAEILTQDLTIHEIDSNTVDKKLVLDGQQRITSIFRALKDADSVYFLCKNLSEDQKQNIDNLNLEEILEKFSDKESADHLSIKLHHVWFKIENTIRESYVEENYFGNQIYVEKLKIQEKEKEFEFYLSVFSKIEDLFKSEKLLSFYLLNTSSEKFALFYERSNSIGLRLDFIDILAAKLYSGFNLRRKISEFEKENDYELNREIIVRYISLKTSNFSYVDKSHILNNLTYHHFNENWESACKLYIEALNFLTRNNYTLSQDWLPYPNMIIPIMVFIENSGNNISKINSQQKLFFSWWYWSSIFTERYSTASNETIVYDSKMLLTVGLNKKFREKSIVSEFKVAISSTDDIKTIRRKSASVSTLYTGFLNLVNFESNGLLDWSNNFRIARDDSTIHDHHIFPKNYLETSFSNNEEVLEWTDSIANRTLIPKFTNLKIGKKPPSEYLEVLKNTNSSLEESLQSHSINPELLIGNFDKYPILFFSERAEILLKLLKKVTEEQSSSVLEAWWEDIQNDRNYVRVFAYYAAIKYEGVLNLSTKKIDFRGEELAPTTAAQKINQGNKRGWDFWHYLTSDGHEKTIQDLK